MLDAVLVKCSVTLWQAFVNPEDSKAYGVKDGKTVVGDEDVERVRRLTCSVHFYLLTAAYC